MKHEPNSTPPPETLRIPRLIPFMPSGGYHTADWKAPLQTNNERTTACVLIPVPRDRRFTLCRFISRSFGTSWFSL